MADTQKQIDTVKKDLLILKKSVVDLKSQREDDQKTIKELQETADSMRNLINANYSFLNDIKELNLGDGADVAMKADRQGLWFGKRKFSEAIAPQVAAPNGRTSTAIGMDGVLYAKDGISLTFGTGMGGPSVTVLNGIITNVV